MQQGELFRSEGDRRKEKGMAQVLANASWEWQLAFEAAAVRRLENNERFTSEDLVDEVGFPPGNRSAVGAQTNRLVRKYGLVSYGRVKARHPQGHSAKIELWGRP